MLFNELFSDPDKNNPDADAAMDVTAQMNRSTAFPLIRLNPKNDAQSQLKVAQIPGVQLKAVHQADSTIAVILPMFGSMHDRLGVANQKPDTDGIVRKSRAPGGGAARFSILLFSLPGRARGLIWHRRRSRARRRGAPNAPA